MLNHLRAAVPIAAQQVSLAKGFQQRLGSIEPRGVDGCKQHMDTGSQILKESGRVRANMTRAIVDNQMDAGGPTVRMQQPPYCWAKMFTIVLVQTLGPHLPIVGGQAGQQADRAMSNIGQFVAFNLAGRMGCVGFAVRGLECRASRQRRGAPPHVATNCQFVRNTRGFSTRAQPPPHPRSWSSSTEIDRGADRQRAAYLGRWSDECFQHTPILLPLAPNCVATNGWFPANAGRLLTSQVFNALALAFGKKHAGGLCAAHHRARPSAPRHDSAHTHAKRWFDSGRLCRLPTSLVVRLPRNSTEFAHVERFARASVHRARVAEGPFNLGAQHKRLRLPTAHRSLLAEGMREHYRSSSARSRNLLQNLGIRSLAGLSALECHVFPSSPKSRSRSDAWATQPTSDTGK